MTSKPFKLTARLPAGGILIGGYTGVSDAHHAAHAADRYGRPLIPSTALRGALRDSLEALLRGMDQPACVAGTGLRPSTGDAESEARSPASQACSLDDGRPCTVCRLFGGGRDGLADGARHFSALVLGDATCEGAPQWTTLPGVAVSRQTRAASEHKLFMRRVPTPRSNLEFAAAGRLLDPALAEHFEAAIRATTHVGSGRSRGLARVDLELAWLDASPSTTPELPNGDLELRLTLRSPTSLGAPVAGDNLRGTRQEIPGSALRGALGFALAEALPQASEQIFVDLFGDGQEHHPGATFGFLYPTAIQRDPEASPSGKAGRVPDPSLFPATPLPLTATACKFDPRRHPRHDILLDRIASHLAASAADARNVHESSLQRCTHPGCEAPLRGQHGVRGLHEGVPTRLISRVSLDRSRASARDGQLFTQELLTPGTTFTGTIRNIPSGSREHLALALAQPLSLGRGRSSGWGRVEVSVQPAPVAPDIVARAEAFDRALGQRLARVRLPTARIGRLIPITLHSPLVPVTDDGRAELLESVAPATLLFSARRFTRDGGWDQRAGLMQPLLTVEAGAVFVLELPEGQHWREFLAQLRHLEASGLGTRRHQGFGHALCFDPFHAQPATTK